MVVPRLFDRQLIRRYHKNLFAPKTLAVQYKETNDGFGARVLDSGISSTLLGNFAGFDAHTLDTKALDAHNWMKMSGKPKNLPLL